MSADLILANRLGECEAAISRGMDTFIEVGSALAEIRDRKLYRLGWETFEAYCQERWGLARRTAYNMIESADAVCAIAHIPNVPAIANEAQAREVAAIIKTDGPERAAEILTEVAEDGPVTAKAIREAARPTREVTTSETVTVDAETGEIVPPAPSKPHRRPLPDAMRDASHELLKSAQRLERLTSDDRWPRNAKQATAMTRGDLLQAIDALTTVLDRLDQSASAA